MSQRLTLKQRRHLVGEQRLAGERRNEQTVINDYARLEAYWRERCLVAETALKARLA